MPCSPSRCTGSCWTAEAAANPPTALLAFVPNGDPTCDRRWVMLCHTETSPTVADTALPEITRIVNAVGRPSYNSNQPRALTNACFHCHTAITGDELADQERRDELDGYAPPSTAPATSSTTAILFALPSCRKFS